MSGIHPMSLLGILAIVGIATLCSSHRSKIRWKGVCWALGFQFVFAALILKTTVGKEIFSWVNGAIVRLMGLGKAGAEMVFGVLGLAPEHTDSLGFFFAFQVLPMIIFLSSLISVLYYLGVMQYLVLFFAKVMRRLTGTSGAESLSASANIFLGQTEAPVLIRPYIGELTRSELLCVMVGGMATVSGGIMGAYVEILKGYFPDIAGHLLAASVMAAPAGIAMAKILIPETEEAKTTDGVTLQYHEASKNVIEAASSGAEVGMRLALNVAAMLIAFMGLLALANSLLFAATSSLGFEGVTIQQIFGFIFTPLAFLMGVPWGESFTVASLIGEKTILNEIVAYGHLGEILRNNPQALTERSVLICSYALCGFANILSIGIQIGGIGALAPKRKSDLASLGLKALLGGSLASFLTASVAALLSG